MLSRPPAQVSTRQMRYHAVWCRSCVVLGKQVWHKTSVSSPLCFFPPFPLFLLAQREVFDSRLTLNYFWLLQDCTKLSGDIPVNPSGGIEYFVYGVHTLTMRCPVGQSVQGHCDTNQVRSILLQPSAASCLPSPPPPCLLTP